jgi:dihydrofolate reductase
MGNMSRLVATEYVTLDGVMEEPGKWSFPFWNDEAAKFKFDELFASDSLVLGRVTYEGFAAAWPTYSDVAGFADRMNNLPKYVVSSTLQGPAWNNSHVITGNVTEEIAKLKRQPAQDILLAGSAQLLHTLMEHNLVDEYRLMVYPLALGTGKRLFKDGLAKTTLRLAGSQTTSTGVVILTYHPVRAE